MIVRVFTQSFGKSSSLMAFKTLPTFIWDPKVLKWERINLDIDESVGEY